MVLLTLFFVVCLFVSFMLYLLVFPLTYNELQVFFCFPLSFHVFMDLALSCCCSLCGPREISVKSLLLNFWMGYVVLSHWRIISKMLNTVSFWGGNSSCFIDLEKVWLWDTVQLQAPVYSFVTLGKLFNVSQNQFCHLENEKKNKSQFSCLKN